MKKISEPLAFYIRSVNRNMSRYGGFLLFLFFISFFDALLLHQSFPGIYPSWAQVITPVFLWSLPCYLLVVLIPWKRGRQILSIGIVLCISLLYLTDAFLIATYRMPYTENAAVPLLSTNMEETVGFLHSVWQQKQLLFEYTGWIFLAVLLSFSPRLLKTIYRFLKHTFQRMNGQQCHRFQKSLVTFLLVAGCVSGVMHLQHIRSSYRDNWIPYHRLPFPSRAWMAHKMVKKEIALSSLYSPSPTPDPSLLTIRKRLPPHHVVLLFDRWVYPSLMHCYGHPEHNTPSIDSMKTNGTLFVHDRAYTADAEPNMALAKTLSFFSNRHSDSWTQHPSLSGVLKLIGYKTYWLDNTPKVEPWIEVTPQLAAECDSTLHTNLRASEVYWSERKPLDSEILKHLDLTYPKQASRFTVIHLMGAAPYIWKCVPPEFNQFNAETIGYPGAIPFDQLHEYAEYHNFITYRDFLLKEVIKSYASLPALIVYVGNVGASGEQHPYSLELIRPEDQHRVPFFIHVSPLMQQIAPELLVQIERLRQQQLYLDSLPEILADLLSFHYSEP